jgi:general secretion pathway protein G
MRTRPGIGATARGFTLLELTVVVMVVGILAAIVAPVILDKVDDARLGRGRSDTQELGTTIARMRMDTSTQSAECLTNTANLLSPTAPVPCGANMGTCQAADQNVEEPCWNGPYMTNVINDPWNNPFRISADAETFTVSVTSAGPDGQFGTSDDLTFVQ